MSELFRSAQLRAIFLLICVCVAGASLKLTVFGTTYSSDYEEYVAVAQHMSGDYTTDVRPHRFLKPLNPALVAAIATVTDDYHTAFILQALIFYIAFVLAVYVLAREFLDDILLSFLVASYVALSYPILKYGVDILTETGALFFYSASLILTLRYIKAPGWKLLLINATVVTIGFLWKEYSIVAAIIFGLSILFHSSLSVRTKIQHVAVYAAMFLAVHVPVQIYVYIQHGYSYLSWYSEGVNGAIKQNEFTLKNIIKSTAALLSVLWLVVPLGFMRYKLLESWQKRFWQVSIAPPLIGYAWGYISSRLLFVMAPPFLLVAAIGMRTWNRPAQIALFVVASVANIAWLFASYQIKL